MQADRESHQDISPVHNSGFGDDCPEDLIELLHVNDSSIRLEAVEKLRPFGGETVRAHIKQMLSDSWNVVRIEAIEYIEAWSDFSAIPLLVDCLADEDLLVRRYAACALGRLQAREILPIAKKTLESQDELDDDERLGYSFALCIFGESGWLPTFLEGFFSNASTVRCATANYVTEILSDKSASFVLSLLEILQEREKSEAVKPVYQETIRIILKEHRSPSHEA